MQRWFLLIFLFASPSVFGQDFPLNTFLTWFESADLQTVKKQLESDSYQLEVEKDSLNLHFIKYVLPKSTTATQPSIVLLFNDSVIEYFAVENYDPNVQKALKSQLKAQRFQTINADVNGNFITTVYDNDRFLLNQDYEAIENPTGKGQIPYYRYRIYRKYGKFDTMNGEKTVMASENGVSYVGIRENYKNGVLSGERTFYYPDGTVKRKENYQAGRLNGLVSDYNKEGKLTHSITHSYHWKYGMEKWYNTQEKVVKTLQWQRDVAVGAEKQTYNGQVVGSIPYVKGVRQGSAKIPIYYDEHISANYPLDTLNDRPLAIETVTFENGLRSGKAVCIGFNSNDTMYVAYYKAGKLDSTYLRYGLNAIYYSTNYVNGLQEGSRIFRIPDGPLKDTIHRIEHYRNGKLDGLAAQYYLKEPDEYILDPDPGSHEYGTITNYPKHIIGPWVPNYYFETYKDGVRNGSFAFYPDSMNYSKGTYVNGKQDGLQEYGMVFGKKWTTVSGNYEMGIKTGLWVTNSVFDSIVLTENYLENKKNGITTKVVKGIIVEERSYHKGTLQTLKFFDHSIETCSLNIEDDSQDKIVITQTLISGDTTRFFTYQIPRNDFPKSDTLLAVISKYLKDEKSLMLYYGGKFFVETKDYKQTGMLSGATTDGTVYFRYKKEGIVEAIEYKNRMPIKHFYSTAESQPYSGTFYSAASKETISVKNGLRHGWCIQYDVKNQEVQQTKYVKGVAKKLKNDFDPKSNYKF